MNQVPKALIGSIGGSGTWGAKFPEDFSDNEVRVIQHYEGFATPFSQSAPFKLLSANGVPILRVAMHGCYPNGQKEMIPPWISAKQVAWVLKEAGVKYVLTDGSVGGIQHPVSGKPLPPWSVVIPDDFIMDWVPPLDGLRDGRVENTGDGTFYRIAQPFCEALSRKLDEKAQSRPEFVSASNGGIYACTQWGRFETKAEINRLRRDGAAIVGQTVAHEAIMARAFGYHLASLNIVSNHAEGYPVWIGDGPEDMAKFYHDCPKPVGQTLIAALKAIANDGVGNCQCQNYVLTGLGAFPVEGA